jgi:hypothetical protein
MERAKIHARKTKDLLDSVMIHLFLLVEDAS